MSSVHESSMTDIELKTKEAEAYRTHGLLQESLEIYEGILSSAPVLQPVQKKTFQDIIRALKKEIEALDQADATLTSEDISIFKETWTSEDNVQEVFGSISAYRELGLFNEAIDEYMKLFALDYPVANIIPGLAECLFKVHSPSRVIDQIEKIMADRNLKDQDKAEIKFFLAKKWKSGTTPTWPLNFSNPFRK